MKARILFLAAMVVVAGCGPKKEATVTKTGKDNQNPGQAQATDATPQPKEAPQPTQEGTAMAPPPSPEAAVPKDGPFGLRLMAMMASRKNVVISPFSIRTAMALVAEGAKGTTRSQIVGTLSLGSSPAQEMESLFVEMKKDAREVALELANRGWVRPGFELKPGYLATLRKLTTMDLVNLDMSDPHAAAQKVNDWVKARTHGLIPSILEPGHIRATTVFIVTNALYFKGAWASPFKAMATREEEFLSSSGARVKVKMMHKDEKWPRYAEMDVAGVGRVKVLSLPYRDKPFALVLLLPAKPLPDGASRLAAGLTPSDLDAALSVSRMEGVCEVALPRFTIETSIEMNPILQKMGVTNAFVPGRADFGAMSNAKDLYVDKVLHRAKIAVDESGTEAAAATAVTMAIRAVMRPPHKRVEFRADHPFIALLVHTPSRTVLFFAIVNEPSHS